MSNQSIGPDTPDFNFNFKIYEKDLHDIGKAGSAEKLIQKEVEFAGLGRRTVTFIVDTSIKRPQGSITAGFNQALKIAYASEIVKQQFLIEQSIKNAGNPKLLKESMKGLSELKQHSVIRLGGTSMHSAELEAEAYKAVSPEEDLNLGQIAKLVTTVWTTKVAEHPPSRKPIGQEQYELKSVPKAVPTNPSLRTAPPSSQAGSKVATSPPKAAAPSVPQGKPVSSSPVGPPKVASPQQKDKSKTDAKNKSTLTPKPPSLRPKPPASKPPPLKPKPPA